MLVQQVKTQEIDLAAAPTNKFEDSSSLLDNYLAAGRWSDLEKLLRKQPKLVSEPTRRYLSLLHHLAEIDGNQNTFNCVPLTTLELVVSLYPEAITLPNTSSTHHHGAVLLRHSSDMTDSSIHKRTPLHDWSSHPAKLRVLLQHLSSHKDKLLVTDRYGHTALHCALLQSHTRSRDDATSSTLSLEAVQMLVESNPQLLHQTTHNRFHSLRILWDCYLADREAFRFVQNILDQPMEDFRNVKETKYPKSCWPAHFLKFWNVMEYLAIQAFLLTGIPAVNCKEAGSSSNYQQYQDFMLHGLLHCTNAFVDLLIQLVCRLQPHLLYKADGNGNLPLHTLLIQHKQSRPARLHRLVRVFLTVFPEAALIRNSNHHNQNQKSTNGADEGDLPLHLALRGGGVGRELIVGELLQAAPSTVHSRDRLTGLYPFQMAAYMNHTDSVHLTFSLLLQEPRLLRN